MVCTGANWCYSYYFYPRPPGGGRLLAESALICHGADFYPRPPGGGRRTPLHACSQLPVFLSTPSGWRATSFSSHSSHGVAISIHALRVEGDRKICQAFLSIFRFLSTPSGWRATLSPSASSAGSTIFLSTPSGWRATANLRRSLTRCLRFLSTPSGWRATDEANSFDEYIQISIHALRVEGDKFSLVSRSPLDRFLSTPSGWRATFLCPKVLQR